MKPDYVDIWICNFNTTQITNNAIKSIIKNIKSFKYTINIFDNSDTIKFILDNDIDKNIVKIYDNTQGKIINFTDYIVNNLQKSSTYKDYASIKHCKTIQYIIDNCIHENVLLFDSDIILKKDIDFIDDDYITCSDILKTDDDILLHSIHQKYNLKTRFLPFIQYFNIKKIKENKINYFDINRIIYGKNAYGYDTGASFYEDVIHKNIPYKKIIHTNYIEHLGGCSFHNSGKNTLLPKKLFFVWIGNNKPDYVNHTIDKFRKLNPSFDIECIEYNIYELEYIGDIEKGKITKTIKYEHDWLLNLAIHYTREKIEKEPNLKINPFIKNLIEIYGWFLVNHFGGIYISCNCFPIKPFDDIFLSQQKIQCTRIDNCFTLMDNFMFGCVKGCSGTSTTLLYPIVDELPKEYKDKFIKCQLNIGDMYNNNQHCYVDHFSGINNDIDICKYDYIL